ncbi:MAG: hypothetical protein NTY66_00915 [Candidatus Vogelbacteria bacterium]|nr:hypothetical protein [Candidatus Vogelbacteria bacterium]
MDNDEPVVSKSWDRQVLAVLKAIEARLGGIEETLLTIEDVIDNALQDAM